MPGKWCEICIGSGHVGGLPCEACNGTGFQLRPADTRRPPRGYSERPRRRHKPDPPREWADDPVELDE